MTLAVLNLKGQGQIESPYSGFGIGDILQTPSARIISMGGTNYAVPARTYLNYVNPAGIGEIDSLTFTFDFGLNGGVRSYSTSDSESPITKNDVQITNLIFGFRVNNWWASSFGVLPFSNIAYDIEFKESDIHNVDKIHRFAGNGGINRAFWTNAVSITDELIIGASFSYIFGNIIENNSLNFDDESGAYTNILKRNSINISDFMFDFGLRYSFDLNNNNKLHLAGVYNYSSDINATYVEQIFNFPSVGGSAVVDTIYNSGIRSGTITYPQKIGGGICYEHNEKLLLGFDYTLQNWSEAEMFGINKSLENSSKFNLGLEYRPAGVSRRAIRYSQAISYRFGAHLNNTYLNVMSNDEYHQINDFGISFGLGLPVERSNTSFNFAVQVGKRGTTDNDLIEENYIIFAINFNLSDRWFMRRKFE